MKNISSGDMTRVHLGALTFAVWALVAAASTAGAQDRVAIRITDEATRLELADIDRQSSQASHGYGWSTAGLLVGGATLTLGVLVSITPGGGDAFGHALSAIGGILAGAGLVGMMFAIDADITSGRRRARWREDHGLRLLALSVAPTPDGVSVSLGGRF